MARHPLPTSPHPPFQLADVGAAFGVIFIWGLNFVAMKYALRDFTPFQLGAARYVFAALPLVFFIARPRLPVGWLLAGGLAQLGQFAFLFLALRDGMTAAMASVLMQTQLFFTTLLGVALLGERLARTGTYALVLAALGLACFGVSAAQGGGAITLTGLLLNLAAAAMWAVANIVARRAQQAHPHFDALQYVVWSSLVPILPFMALAWFLDPGEVRWNWTDARASSWASAVFLGLIATVAAYALWTQLLKRHAASRVAPFSLGVPVVGLGAAIFLLGETVTALQWAGSALVVGALLVFMGARRRG